MTVISLDTAIQHLRAEDDDAEYVSTLLEAAEDVAVQFLNRRFYASTSSLDAAISAGDAGLSPILITGSIRSACLLILGNLYSNREDSLVGDDFSSMPAGSRTLLTPYRIGWGI